MTFVMATDLFHFLYAQFMLFLLRGDTKTAFKSLPDESHIVLLLMQTTKITPFAYTTHQQPLLVVAPL